MNKFRFQLNKEKNYVIYGAGGDGRKLISTLQKYDITPSAVIDKRAEEIREINQVPVLNFTSWIKQNNNPEQTVVIITIKNVFGHTDIAREFCMEGYHQLVYMPLPLLQGEQGEHWDSIGQAYEMLVAKNCFPMNMLVCVTRASEMLVFKDVLSYKCVGNERIVWMPTELLFNYDVEEAWGQLGMELFFPIVQLYQSLLGTNTGLWESAKEDYILYCGEYLKKNNLEMTKKQKDSFIESRVNVFYEMEKKYDITPDFFIESAPKAVLGSDGRFFLVASGRNRLAFQIAKGCRYLPVRLSEEDFAKWSNRAVFEKTKELLQQVSVNRIFTSVAHPLLAGYPVVATNYSRLVCCNIALYFIKAIYKESQVDMGTYHVLDRNIVRTKLSKIKLGVWVKDEGALSRYLSRNEIAHIVVENGSIDAELSEAFNLLLGVKKAVSKCMPERMVWSELDFLVLDSRVAASIPESYVGDIVFLILWEDTSQIEEYMGDVYEVKENFFFAVWEGKEVNGYLLKRKGDSE